MALNGQFPSAMLANLGWPEADHHRLVPDAAASLTRLAAKFEAHFGYPLLITDAYRTLATQVSLKIRKGTFAARPGTSNHGLGLAIDMSSRINVENSDEHRWMELNGPHSGWINPYWAVDRNRSNGEYEPWHWEYNSLLDRSTDVKAATGTNPTPLKKGPFMALSDQQQLDLLNAVARLDASWGARGPATGKLDAIGQAVVDIRGGVAGLPSLIAQVDNPDVDNAAIAAAVVAAVPASISQQVVDLLLARLAA